jgi:hypothetical protein
MSPLRSPGNEPVAQVGPRPGRAINCQSCGKKVATHWIAIFAAIPAFLGGFALMKSESVALGIAAVVGGILLMGVLQTFLVPLVRVDA